jgi:antitoxin CcdA
MRMTPAHNARNACEIRGAEGLLWRKGVPRPAMHFAKRPVNVSVSSDLLEAARKAGVNLSALLERTLAQELKRLQRRQWREDNARAICAYNDHIALHGTCFEGRWDD